MIGKRMVEECCRIFGYQAAAARGLRCNRKLLSEWNNGVTPSTFLVAKMHYCGGDVLYILTGQRGDPK